MPIKITNKYARISPQTWPGTRRKVRSPSRQTKAKTFKSTVTNAIKKNDALRLSQRASLSRCPKRMENSAPLPMHRPRIIEVINVISVKAEPTAARASRPRNCPTISVSAML